MEDLLVVHVKPQKNSLFSLAVEPQIIRKVAKTVTGIKNEKNSNPFHRNVHKLTLI